MAAAVSGLQQRILSTWRGCGGEELHCRTHGSREVRGLPIEWHCHQCRQRMREGESCVLGEGKLPRK